MCAVPQRTLSVDEDCVKRSEALQKQSRRILSEALKSSSAFQDEQLRRTSLVRPEDGSDFDDLFICVYVTLDNRSFHR